VQILHRLYQTGILIKVLDLDNVVQRAAALNPAVPLRNARITRIARPISASASRIALGHLPGRPRAASEERAPNHAMTTYGKNFFSKAEDRPYPALSRLANSSHS
jgi:hypothetical protein